MLGTEKLSKALCVIAIHVTFMNDFYHHTGYAWQKEKQI